MGFIEDYRTYKQLAEKEGTDSPSAIGAFKGLAQKYFGCADSETLRKRKEFKDLGFAVVNHDGMTHEQALAVLHSKETLAICAGDSW